MNKNDKPKSFIQIVFDLYWFIKKRIRVFFWLTTVVLIFAISAVIFIETHSLEYVWIAFVVGPGIMLLVFISHKIGQYEDKHGLTHYKFFDGGFIYTTFPMRKNTEKKKKKNKK
jgi:O-antigen/teichoic acid export membrane protein